MARKAGSAVFASYNIHKCVGSDRRFDPHRVQKVIGEIGADVIALQEADGPSAWSGNFDHVALLSTLTDCCAHYRGEHNAFNLGGTALASGTALLSRLPFRETRSHRFGTSWRADPREDLVGILMVQRLFDPVVIGLHADVWTLAYQAIDD